MLKSSHLKNLLWGILLLLLLALVLIYTLVPRMVDNSVNGVEPHSAYPVSARAQQLHNSLIIGDWHADSTLWNRDLSQRNNIGHVDLPRLRAGNVGLQMFTTVTKSPSGLNYHHNQASTWDDITSLAIVQRWPLSTHTSLTARALHQANKLHKLAAQEPDFVLIKSRNDLLAWQAARAQNPQLVGGLIGTEGSHALDGKLANVATLFDAGFRMMSLQHFFDNKLGASLHGVSQSGLTPFGRAVVDEIAALDIILDVSHSSEQVVREVLSLTDKPVVVSHTGFNGHCPSPRNIDDSLMQQIAAQGGLIAVGFWRDVVCGPSVKDLAQAIQYGIRLVGAQHVALGSDYDGSVTAIITSDEMAALTQALLDLGVSEHDIRQVMGENTLRFLLSHLPDNNSSS